MNHYLNGLESQFTWGINAYYCKSSKNPMVMEVIGTRVECITVVLLSGHGIKLSSEYSCLYTKINAATISLGQRSF